MLYQQGDVLIRRIERIPDGAKKIKPTKRGFILAEGEATGHAHVVSDNTASMYTVEDQYVIQELMAKYFPEWSRAMWPMALNILEIINPAAISHQEHGAFTIDTGIYAVPIVQEYDHFAEEARNVKD